MSTSRDFMLWQVKGSGIEDGSSRGSVEDIYIYTFGLSRIYQFLTNIYQLCKDSISNYSVMYTQCLPPLPLPHRNSAY